MIPRGERLPFVVLMDKIAVLQGGSADEATGAQ